MIDILMVVYVSPVLHITKKSAGAQRSAGLPLLGIILLFEVRMLTAFKILSSPIPGFFVCFDLQPIHQLIEATEQVHNRHKFEHRLVIES